MTESTTVRRATPAESDQVVRTIVEAFQDEVVACWLFPSEPDRRRLLPRLYGALGGQIAAKGEALFAGPDAGVSLWLPVRGGGSTFGDVDSAALEAAFGPRMPVLAELLTAHHPGSDHLYLAAMGVLPAHRSTGLGGAMLRHRLAQADADGEPVYLEASDPRNRALYARHGFRDLGEPITLPDGPQIFPMWREPLG